MTEQQEVALEEAIAALKGKLTSTWDCQTSVTLSSMVLRGFFIKKGDKKLKLP